MIFLILRLNKKYSDEKIKRIVEDLRNYAKGKLILLPNDIDIVKYNNYKVWSKDEFTKYILSRRVIQKKTIDDTWNKISKGYNFVIAKYNDDGENYTETIQDDIKDYDIFSVEKINELFSTEKDEQESTIIKEDEIKIKEVILQENQIRNESEIIALVLYGIKVRFEYKCMEVESFIETNKPLTIKEIKQEIIKRSCGKQDYVKEDM